MARTRLDLPAGSDSSGRIFNPVCPRSLIRSVRIHLLRVFLFLSSRKYMLFVRSEYCVAISLHVDGWCDRVLLC
uniref:Uncharacterized protein n=1 Tax=Arundo donax TaxID=35708 RepID=A0A0A9FXW7_ARUDO